MHFFSSGLESCYDGYRGGDTFSGLKIKIRMTGAPELIIVGSFSSFFWAVLVLVHLLIGHGIVHRVALSIFSFFVFVFVCEV